MTKADRIALRIFLIWWLGCVLSYGNVVRYYQAENDAECAAEYARDPKGYCSTHVRMPAVLSSAFWPLYWSERLWK